MILNISLHPPRFPIETNNFQFRSLPSLSLSPNKFPSQISCSRKKFSDADLASGFAKEVEKINTNLIKRDEAMKKSREFLFTELCGFQGLKSDDMVKKWKKMNEDSKLELAKTFVSDWGFNFQPLSSRSVKEMIDEFVNGENESVISYYSDSSLGLKLKGIMGFLQS